MVLSSDQVEEIVAVDLALQRLAKSDERKSKVLEMRFFGGLSVEETAESIGSGAEHGHPGLEFRPRMAAPRTERRWDARQWNDGNRLRRSFIGRCSTIPPSAKHICAKPAAETRLYAAKSPVCSRIMNKAPGSSRGPRRRPRN